MTSVAIIADTHFGALSDSLDLLRHQRRFFDELFFPELERRGIEHVVHLGDLTHRRKYVNFQTLSAFREFFLDRLTSGGYEAHLICGNHDVFFKSTNRVSSIVELCARRNIQTYVDPRTATIAGERFAVLPWMNKENETEWREVLTRSPAEICLGHLEISGFAMTRGLRCEHGWSPSAFQRFDRVFSGHFHLRSEDENILYVGAPYDLDWSDWGAEKGFHVLDLETRGVEFVPFRRRFFHKVFVGGDVERAARMVRENHAEYEGSVVKVLAGEGDGEVSPVTQALEDAGAADVRVTREVSSLDAPAELSGDVTDTLTMLHRSVDELTSSERKRRALRRVMSELYQEAQSLDT